MTNFAELAARVAPDYGRMLGRMAGAMLADASETPEAQAQQAEATRAADGQTIAHNGVTGRADNRAIHDGERQAAKATKAPAPLQPSFGRKVQPVQINGAQAPTSLPQAEVSELTRTPNTAEGPEELLHFKPGQVVEAGKNAVPKNAAFLVESADVRLRLRARSQLPRQSERAPIEPRKAVAPTGLKQSRDLLPELGALCHEDVMPSRVFRIHRPAANIMRRALTLDGQGTSPPHPGELPSTAWAEPDLLAPRGWPDDPSPFADPFADSALEDALGELLERTALTAGIDL